LKERGEGQGKRGVGKKRIQGGGLAVSPIIKEVGGVVSKMGNWKNEFGNKKFSIEGGVNLRYSNKM